IVDRWSAKIWQNESKGYVDHRYESAEILINNHLGYGIVINLSKTLALNQSVGAGIYYSTTDNDERSGGAPEISDHNVKGYTDLGFTWGLDFSFVYKLK
ncbi:hypothetical protein, partial [Fulvivirga aurantia]|uniref:hypothetical protein n=1 Tax=Fulvivirga aurantia TaxID=2529383 RepID=UPI0016240558